MRTSEIPCIDYEDLLESSSSSSGGSSSNIKSIVREAYGQSGLGILAVTGIPEVRSTALRKKLLPLAHRLATLPCEVLREYEHPSSNYAIGWSLGKERLQNGLPDVQKASFYANPVHDRPVDDEALIKQWPEFVHPNIWPCEEHVPGLKAGFKELGREIIRVGMLVARQCDAIIGGKKNQNQNQKGAGDEGGSGGAPQSFETIIEKSRCCKGRLLYYYPSLDDNDVSFASFSSYDENYGNRSSSSSSSLWCGWHNDHCLLTGLCPGMGLSKEDGSPLPAAQKSSSWSGLEVMDRKGIIHRVVLPASTQASCTFLYQIGETAQILSGGQLQATPHCVRRPPWAAAARAARASFAVFMEPEWDFLLLKNGFGAAGMEEGGGEEDEEGKKKEAPPPILPQGVTPLEERWKNSSSMTFGEFTVATYKAFYSSS